MNTDANHPDDYSKLTSADPFVQKLIDEIESNLNNDQFGVDNLAQSIGMSRSGLHRKLNKHLGVSASQFIREYRLRRALEILSNEDITASEAAYRVGFSTASYFNTCFHKFYGYTPGEVKSRKRGEYGIPNEHANSKVPEGFSSKPKISKTGKRGIKKNQLLVGSLVLLLSFLALFFYKAILKEEGKKEPVIDGKSIAVLPIKNWTGDPDLEYISDGMTDAIISRLTKISAMDKVVPFTSTIKFKKTDKTGQEIAKELGVTNLLQGNLQISGDRIKVNVQLINAPLDNHFWSEEFIRDWKSDEIFSLQNEVVEGIASVMKASVVENELIAIQRIPTDSKQAYSYYLQAEFQKNKFSKLAYANAIPLYEKAIAIDSNFVEAYVSMANIWSFGGLMWGIHDQQLAWNNAKVLLKKALEIDPENKAAEEELNTGYFYYDWDFPSVEKYYQANVKDHFFDKTAAIAVDYATKTGKYEESLTAIEHLIALDPTDGVTYPKKAEALMLLGKTEEAKNVVVNTDSLYADNWFFLRESAKLHYYLGEYEKSRNLVQKMTTRFANNPPTLLWFRAIYAQMDGNEIEAEKHLKELLKRYDEHSPGSPAWFIALHYCALNDYENAFKWLQRSYERHEVEMTWLREEPLLAPLRNDPRYKDLYDRVGFSSIGLPIKSPSKNQFVE